MTTPTPPVMPAPERRFGCLQVALIVIAAMVVTAVATFWIIRSNLFPADFKPVTLDAGERQVLEAKLERLESPVPQRSSAVAPDTGGGEALRPEAYSESGARREIEFTERELNALLARNTDLARKLALDLSEDLVSAKLLVPVDPDFPIMGGKILKVRAGLELAYDAGRPIVVLRGISIMGVPLPNAWLGGIKNIDLVSEFGDAGFWQGFADGIEHIRVEDGRLNIKLKE